MEKVQNSTCFVDLCLCSSRLVVLLNSVSSACQVKWPKLWHHGHIYRTRASYYRTKYCTVPRTVLYLYAITPIHDEEHYNGHEGTYMLYSMYIRKGYRKMLASLVVLISSTSTVRTLSFFRGVSAASMSYALTLP